MYFNIKIYFTRTHPPPPSPKGYDPKCNPTIVNEFATAAYRFGHSLLRPELKRMDEQYGDLEPSLRLRDVFFNPDHLYERGMIDELMRGFTTVSMETLDQFITEEVTNHLFEDKKVPFSGMDLASLNIQRGQSYTYNKAEGQMLNL